MSTHTLRRCSVLSLLACVTFLLLPSRVNAHCDTMNGPVVIAAKKALETGNVSFVLIWVKQNDEAEIKMAFEKTLAVRKLSAEARKLADMYFFETLVRVHRAGEGVPYTGLKPAETAVDPGIEAADRALETGSAEQLLKHLNEAVRTGIHQKFEQAMSKRKFTTANVEAGREYVDAYVQFIHYAERLFQAASKPAGHLHEGE